MKKEKLQHCVNAIKAMAVEQLATTGDIYAMMHICAEKNDIDAVIIVDDLMKNPETKGSMGLVPAYFGMIDGALDLVVTVIPILKLNVDELVKVHGDAANDQDWLNRFVEQAGGNLADLPDELVIEEVRALLQTAETMYQFNWRVDRIDGDNAALADDICTALDKNEVKRPLRSFMQVYHSLNDTFETAKAAAEERGIRQPSLKRVAEAIDEGEGANYHAVAFALAKQLHHQVSEARALSEQGELEGELVPLLPKNVLH